MPICLPADRAYPIVGQVFESRTGVDAVLRVARLRVVNVFTDGATILFHAVKKFKKIHTGLHKYNTDVKYLKIFL